MQLTALWPRIDARLAQHAKHAGNGEICSTLVTQDRCVGEMSIRNPTHSTHVCCGGCSSRRVPLPIYSPSSDATTMQSSAPSRPAGAGPAEAAAAAAGFSVDRQNSCASGPPRTAVTGRLVSQGSAPSGAGHPLGAPCSKIEILSASSLTSGGAWASARSRLTPQILLWGKHHKGSSLSRTAGISQDGI